jgi:hypothetical protein
VRTETPRIRQLTFQLEHAPYVLTRRALAAAATAPSHRLPAGRSRNSFIPAGGVTAEKADGKNSSPVYLSSQQKERRFLPGPRSGVSAPEM